MKSPLTPNEEEIMNHLVDAWNKFIDLQEMHPDEINDFKDAIHKAQRILSMRTLRRDYPDYYNKIKNKQ
jgi:hypothetical protein